MHKIVGSTFVAGLALAIAALLTLTTGCRAGGGSASAAKSAPPLALRSFQVAPEQAPELASIINRVLYRGDGTPPAGRAQLGPNGLLVVAAPEKLLDQIDRLVADVGKRAPKTMRMVTMTYWVVLGQPADATTWPAHLAELKPALESIASAEGPTSFKLLERSQITSLSGERTKSSGKYLRIDPQVAAVQDGHVIANLSLKLWRWNGGIATRVSLSPGKLLVLGQSGVAIPPKEDTNQSVYYVVRADVGSQSATQS